MNCVMLLWQRFLFLCLIISHTDALKKLKLLKMIECSDATHSIQNYFSSCRWDLILFVVLYCFMIMIPGTRLWHDIINDNQGIRDDSNKIDINFWNIHFWQRVTGVVISVYMNEYYYLCGCVCVCLLLCYVCLLIHIPQKMSNEPLQNCMKYTKGSGEPVSKKKKKRIRSECIVSTDACDSTQL